MREGKWPVEGQGLKEFRRHVQMVFQDPYSSLDPRQTLKTIVERPLVLNTNLKSADRLDKVVEILHQVGLDSGQLNRYPHEFSGGPRQRIAVARALAVNPSMIVCDEPVSALDVSIQAQILNLFKTLQKDLGLAYLFVSHDLNVVRHVSHEVAVIYMGTIVEIAPNRRPVSKSLASLHPGPFGFHARSGQKGKTGKAVWEKSVPPLIRPQPGCRLAPRCPNSGPDCRNNTPELKEISPGHMVGCIKV